MAIDTHRFKELLEKEKQRLENELATVGTRNPSNPDDWVARADDINVDQADANEASDKYESYETNQGIETQLEIHYNNVKAALERIENGTYGVCTVCGTEIAQERLEAYPSAATCIEHADNAHG